MKSVALRTAAVLTALASITAGTGVMATAEPQQSVAVATPQLSVLVRPDGSHLRWFMRQPTATGTTTVELIYGRATDRPVWGDWDGNGTVTAGVVRDGVWLLRNGAGGGNADVPAFRYGRAGDRPIVGDWDGNRTWTAGVVRDGVWLLRNRHSSGNADDEFVYGRSTDTPVTGDWDRNGTFTAGVFRNGVWLLRNGAGGGNNDVPAFTYGRAGDRPIVGDWDGNRTWTAGVVRDGNAWHLRNSHTGGPADLTFGYGRAGDVPLSSGRPPAAPAVTPIDWSRFTGTAPSDSDAKRLAGILRNTNRYANVTWWNATGFANQTGTYLTFGGTGERQIRGPAHEAFALAVSLETGTYDPTTAGASATEARARAVKLARSLARRHLANSGGGGWGSHWQSALWSSRAAFAAWLLWEHLTPAEREYVARMVEFEADRFNGYPVPYYRNRAGTILSPGNTRAEENAWNAMILQVATSMMPDHPRRRQWLAKATELEISAFSRPVDLNDGTVVNGKPISTWLNGSNANNDGFVINHGFVHPDYSTTVAENVHAAPAHSMAGQATPRAAFWGAEHVYDALVDRVWVAGTNYPPGGTVREPGGTVYVDGSERIYYPQGNDWGTDRRIQPTLLDVQARAFGFDRLASQKGDYWQRLHGERVLQMQRRSPDRRTYTSPGEDVYYGREELVAVTAAEAYLTRWIIAQGAFRITDAPIS